MKNKKTIIQQLRDKMAEHGVTVYAVSQACSGCSYGTVWNVLNESEYYSDTAKKEVVNTASKLIRNKKRQARNLQKAISKL